MHAEIPPEEMTPEQRLQSVAAILARGVLRLRKLRALGLDSTSRELPESGSTGLEVSGESRLSGTTG